jgi:hypothetical protein
VQRVTQLISRAKPNAIAARKSSHSLTIGPSDCKGYEFFQNGL